MTTAQAGGEEEEAGWEHGSVGDVILCARCHCVCLHAGASPGLMPGK